MTVHNEGPAAANNVQMRLSSIIPRPRYSEWHADYPYPVKRIVGSGTECRINPNDDEIYEVLSGWQNADGAIYTDGLDTKSAHSNYIGINPAEKWELSFRVTAENADPINFRLAMSVKDGAVLLERKD